MPSKSKRTRAAPRRKPRDAMGALLALTAMLTEGRPLEEALRAVTDAALRLARRTTFDPAARRIAQRAARRRALRHREQHKPMPLAGARRDLRLGPRVQGVGLHRRRRKDPRFAALTGQGFAIRRWSPSRSSRRGQTIGVLSVSSPERRAFRRPTAPRAPARELLARRRSSARGCAASAMTDDLTLAYNQRYLSPRVNEEIERARRSGQPLAMLLLDLDHFKLVNDQHGHDAGDMVLRLFADRVRSIVRRVDVFIRRGGEEFVLLMPATALEQARNTAERIRRNLAAASSTSAAASTSGRRSRSASPAGTSRSRPRRCSGAPTSRCTRPRSRGATGPSCRRLRRRSYAP